MPTVHPSPLEVLLSKLARRLCLLIVTMLLASLAGSALAATASAQSPDLPATCDPLVEDSCPDAPPQCSPSLLIPGGCQIETINCDPQEAANCPPPSPTNPLPSGPPPIPVPCSDPNDEICTTWVDPIQTTGDCVYVNATGQGSCPYIHVGSKVLGQDTGPIYLPNAGAVAHRAVAFAGATAECVAQDGTQCLTPPPGRGGD